VKSLAALILLAPISLGQPETSTIAIPIRSTLAPLLPLIEAQVPKVFRNRVVERGVTIGYDIIRDPIALQMTGTGLRATTVARYALEACPPGRRIPCVSCGVDEARREAVVSVHSRLSWDAGWKLRSTTVPEQPVFPRRCRITWLSLDITDRLIAPAVEDQLKQIATAIDRNTPGMTSIRPRAQQIWSALQEPFQIAPGTWLLFEPLEVGLGPLRGQALQVSTTLALRARTRVVVGARPGVAQKPLPALQHAEWTGGLRIPLDAEVPYADASRVANEQFGKKTFQTRGATFRLENIQAGPGSGGKVLVQATLDYSGGRLKRYTGPIALEGTPRFDAATSRVTVPDLDYKLDPKRKNLFVSAAEVFAHDAVRGRLRESIAFPIGSHLAIVRAEVTRALSRQLAPGVTLRGSINSVQPQAVVGTPGSLVVRLLVTGQAEVTIEN